MNDSKFKNNANMIQVKLVHLYYKNKGALQLVIPHTHGAF